MTGVVANFVAAPVTPNHNAHHDRVPVTGDYTGDGLDDILWWYPVDGSLSLWTGNAFQSFTMTNLVDTVQGFPVGFGLY